MPQDSIIDALKSGRYDYRVNVALTEEPELPFTRRGVLETVRRIMDELPKEGGNAGDTALGSDNGNNGQALYTEAVDNIAKRFKVEWKKYTPNRRIAAVTMPDDGFLRISEVYYPGWRIKANGIPVKYYRSDMAWMAVPLKAGDYEIVMEPKSLYMGVASKVSAAFTLVIAGILAYAFVRKRQGRAAKS